MDILAGILALVIIPLITLCVRVTDSIRFIYSIFPALIIYKHPTPPHHGQAFLFFVFISPVYKNDEGLLAHELMHIKQFYRTFGLHGVLYAISKTYRLYAEIEAYGEQLKYSPEDIDVFAEFIATRYNLNISKPSAHAKLRQRYMP